MKQYPLEITHQGVKVQIQEIIPLLEPRITRLGILHHQEQTPQQDLKLLHLEAKM